MKIFLILSFVLLILPKSEASVSPYNFCLEQAFQKYDNSISMAYNKKEKQTKLCYRFPFGETFSKCLNQMEKTVVEEKMLSNTELVKNKKECLDFL